MGLPTTGTRPTELLPAKPRRRFLPAALPGCGSTSDQVARQGAGCGPVGPEPAFAPARAAVYSEPRPPERQLGRGHEGAERPLSQPRPPPSGALRAPCPGRRPQRRQSRTAHPCWTPGAESSRGRALTSRSSGPVQPGNLRHRSA